MAQVRANARSTTKEILQAQLCPVLSLSLSISLYLSLHLDAVSFSSGARCAPQVNVASHKGSSHTQARDVLHVSYRSRLWILATRRRSAVLLVVEGLDEWRPTNQSRCHALTYVALR